MTLRHQIRQAYAEDLVARGLAPSPTEMAGLKGLVSGGGKTLSMFDANPAVALPLMLAYAASTGMPVALDKDVPLTSAVTIDMAGMPLTLDFGGFAITADVAPSLRVLNPGIKSVIRRPRFVNVTAPWAITRWDASGNWLAAGAATLATLTQTNAPGYYQPTPNDTDIWSSLTTAQQNQQIGAGLYVSGADGLTVTDPSGRFALYEFDMCNRTNVLNPKIESGGKGMYGTILFKNMGTTGYCVGNWVTGGRVQYGSFSGVSFLRNKLGGVVGGLVPFRCGESGVKTFQNEVSGRSSRCYEMSFGEIFPEQCVYDGLDAAADYGTSTERVDDFTLAQYAWNQLPTYHRIWRVRARGCRATGVWGDGQYARLTDCEGAYCTDNGVLWKGNNSEFIDCSAIDCNQGQSGSGVHQINIPGTGCEIRGPRVSTSASFPGYAIFTDGVTTTVSDEKVTGTVTQTLVARSNRSYNNLTLGSDDVTQNNVAINLKPRGSRLANPAGKITCNLTSGASGSERGTVDINGVYGGVPVKGLRASGENGGVGVIAMANSASTSQLNNGECLFYESGGVFKMSVKLANGTLLDRTIA